MSLRMNDILYYGNFTVIAPSHCGFSFVFGHRYLYLVGSSIHLLMVVQDASCEACWRKMSAHLSTPLFLEVMGNLGFRNDWAVDTV